jgi:menaquinone-dependent protoporphyrinogen IX oxidase
MRKLFKVIIAVIVVLVVLFAAFAALFFLDLAAYTASGSQTLTPTGTSIGNALVTYDPGLSADTKAVADKVVADLQTKGYTVVLAGIKSSAAVNTTSYNIIVVGGPVYAGALTASVKAFVGDLPQSLQGVKIGVFGSGQGATSKDDVNQLKQSISNALQTNPSLSNAIVVKIGDKEDITARTQDFVNQLTQ